MSQEQQIQSNKVWIFILKELYDLEIILNKYDYVYYNYAYVI